MHIQAVLKETDYLDPFQSRFSPQFGKETALVLLRDDPCWENNGEHIRVGSPAPFHSFQL